MTSYSLVNLETGKTVFETIANSNVAARKDYAQKHFLEHCPFKIQAIKTSEVF